MSNHYHPPYSVAAQMAMVRTSPFSFPELSRSALPYAPTKSEQEPLWSLDESRTLRGMLLVVGIVAMLVVLEQFIETWAEGSLLVGWVALWAATFTTLALVAPPLNQVGNRLVMWRVQHI